MTGFSRQLRWRKATGCGNTTCVEVADDSGTIFVRDSKRPGVAPLEFTRAEWADFVRRATRGDFDFG